MRRKSEFESGCEGEQEEREMMKEDEEKGLGDAGMLGEEKKGGNEDVREKMRSKIKGEDEKGLGDEKILEENKKKEI